MLVETFETHIPIFNTVKHRCICAMHKNRLHMYHKKILNRSKNASRNPAVPCSLMNVLSREIANSFFRLALLWCLLSSRLFLLRHFLDYSWLLVGAECNAISFSLCNFIKQQRLVKLCMIHESLYHFIIDKCHKIISYNANSNLMIASAMLFWTNSVCCSVLLLLDKLYHVLFGTSPSFVPFNNWLSVNNA